MMDGIVDSYGWYRGVGSFTPRGTASLLAVSTGIVQCLGCNKCILLHHIHTNYSYYCTLYEFHPTHIENNNMNSIDISPLPMLRIT